MKPAILCSLLLVLLFSGCLPVVAHSPWLVPGTTAGMEYGYEGAPRPAPDPDRTGANKALSLGLFLYHNWVQGKDSTGWGASIGALWRPLTGVQADAFARAPRLRPLPLDVGAGVMPYGGPMIGWLPYFQVGVPLPGRTYLFTTQGPLTVRRDYHGVHGMDHPWMSQLGFQVAATKKGYPGLDLVTFQVGGVFGDMQAHCPGAHYDCWTPGRYFARMVIAVRVGSWHPQWPGRD